MCLLIWKFHNIGGAFPLIQRSNILAERAVCSLAQAEIEPAKLAVFITKLLCARSSAKSLVGPFLLKETNKRRHSWRCYVRVFSVFHQMLQDDHRWVTLNGIYWGSDGFHTDWKNWRTDAATRWTLDRMNRCCEVIQSNERIQRWFSS